MKIAFHGAARTVTGSKHLLTLDNGKNVLLDCGMFQGMGKETDDLNQTLGFDATTVSYLILSHAHIDHSGLVPKLVKEGFKGPIFSTSGTKDLCNVLLEDSATIQRDDTKFENKHRSKEGLPPLQPLYSIEDAHQAMNLFIEVPYATWHTIEPGLEVMFTDAGHIIGSAAVSLRITTNGVEQHLTFSGDVGRYNDMILKSPQPFPRADYVLIESTYGNSLHEDFVSTPDALLNWVTKTCIEKKGKLIIPSFSVGRTQELLYILNQLELENRLPHLDYYVDSPLSYEATKVVKEHQENFNSTIQQVLKVDKDPFDFKGLHYIEEADESKELNFRKDPMVIISASGMADAGRVKHHIANNIDDPKNTVLLVGYCEPNSLGGRLMHGAKHVHIFGVEHEVKAEVGQMRSMSAHGDYEDLLQFLSCQEAGSVKQVFIVHGEYDVQQAFRNRLLAKGFPNVAIPERHQSFSL